MSNANISLFRFGRRLAANDNRIFSRLNYAASRPFNRQPSAASASRKTFEPKSRDADPYLLVLLADQEIAANRPDQAQYLIEAAYAVYDQGRLGS